MISIEAAGATFDFSHLHNQSTSSAIAVQPAALVVSVVWVWEERSSFELGIDLGSEQLALVAEQEREAISRRTSEALAAAKARGLKLGNPNGAAALRRAGKGGAPLREAIARNADRHAEDLREVVKDVRSTGATSLRAIAIEMNARGILTRRGGRWHVSTVMNLLARLDRLPASSC